MFDRIAPRYDLLNRLFSFGCDVGWRRRVAERLPSDKPLDLLDLAAGTADVMISLCRRRPNIGSAIGLDLALDMLRLGNRKLVAADLDSRTALAVGDAAGMPFASNSFDYVTIAFGIRNFDNIDASLSEIRRILRPGGKLLILEFSLPSNRIIRAMHLGYLRHVIPALGGLISGDGAAYRHLNTSIERFPYGEAFCELLRRAGFNSVTGQPLTFGVATLYEATAGGNSA